VEAGGGIGSAMANGLVFMDEEEPVGLAMARSSGSKRLDQEEES